MSSDSVLPLIEDVPMSLFSLIEPVTVDYIAKPIMESPTQSCSLDPMAIWLLKKTVYAHLTISKIMNTSIVS